eukprot:TRINITY_DN36575_c0_g2_i2.p1 TRINITY_DN36575_c0_g2~~TRINITY_DN36575_c0_g2_i2.p1  ORF type:complete len:874 (+),score=174.20 TRINITY_DN36575_c0_g2_i2:53-2674(+)
MLELSAVEEGDVAGGTPRGDTPHGCPGGARMLRQEEGSTVETLEEVPEGSDSAEALGPTQRLGARSRTNFLRILARVRPPLPAERDVRCLQVAGATTLEVLMPERSSSLQREASSSSTSLPRQRRFSAGTPPAGHGGHDTLSSCASIAVLSDVSTAETLAGSPTSAAADRRRTYAFDAVLDSSASDDDVFAEVREDVAAALEGYATCIMAYGATGGGKTHTVLNIAQRTARELERQAEALLESARREEGCSMEVAITVQLVEIYNEQLRDLLLPAEAEAPADLKPKLSVASGTPTLQRVVSRTFRVNEGSCTKDLGLAKGLSEAFRIGQANRATSATSVHGRSSRSHLVMTLFLSVTDSRRGSSPRLGKISLADLAGSERLKRSEATGDRLREAQYINRSLSALADVISAKERRGSHIPFRNSKLTHVLKGVLDGQENRRTVVLLALPPGRENLKETVNALQFGSRLSAIALPVLPPRSLVSWLDPAIRRGPGGGVRLTQLEQEVERLKSGLNKASKELAQYRQELERKDTLLERVRAQNWKLREKEMVFERSRECLRRGFDAVSQRLQLVASVAIGDEREERAQSAKSSPRADGPSSPARSLATGYAGGRTLLISRRLQPSAHHCSAEVLPQTSLVGNEPSSSSTSMPADSSPYAAAVYPAGADEASGPSIAGLGLAPKAHHVAPSPPATSGRSTSASPQVLMRQMSERSSRSCSSDDVDVWPRGTSGEHGEHERNSHRARQRALLQNPPPSASVLSRSQSQQEVSGRSVQQASRTASTSRLLSQPNASPQSSPKISLRRPSPPRRSLPPPVTVVQQGALPGDARSLRSRDQVAQPTPLRLRGQHSSVGLKEFTPVLHSSQQRLTGSHVSRR